MANLPNLGGRDQMKGSKNKTKNQLEMSSIFLLNIILFQKFQKLYLVLLYILAWRFNCLLLPALSYMHHSSSTYPWNILYAPTLHHAPCKKLGTQRLKMQVLPSRSLESEAGVCCEENETCRGPIQSSRRGPRNRFIWSYIMKYFVKVSQFVCSWLRILDFPLWLPLHKNFQSLE